MYLLLCLKGFMLRLNNCRKLINFFTLSSLIFLSSIPSSWILLSSYFSTPANPQKKRSQFCSPSPLFHRTINFCRTHPRSVAIFIFLSRSSRKINTKKAVSSTDLKTVDRISSIFQVNNIADDGSHKCININSQLILIIKRGFVTVLSTLFVRNPTTKIF